MAIPEGARYVRGTRNHFVRLPDGTTVTRARAENLHAQSLSGGAVRTNYGLRKLTATARREGFYDTPYWQSRLAEAKRTAERRGQPFRPHDVQARAAMIRDTTLVPRDERGQVIDKSPGGPLAHYLADLGRRDPGADWAVGETPTTK